ncbi:MAG: phytanoyl-CoA dioxygenase family protein [Capsulimonadaceae bacterium]|nr:phytanoyl-CoA dioxygenase family protein [Capsulimonadaceae bacterium]
MTSVSMLQAPAVSPTALTADQIAAYNRDGYVVLPGLVSPGNASALNDEVMGIMDAIGLGDSKLRQTSRYLAGSALDALINSPDLLRIAATLMGGSSTLYLPFTAVKSGGGGGRFHFHQDNQYTRFDGPGINLWFALTEMTPENGCLQVVPGSHLAGTLDADVLADGHRSVQREPDEFVSVLMQPGDCVAFTRLTVHGSGPNVTPSPRVAYAVQFHRDDVNAIWNGSETPVNIKANPRWSTGPVDAIVAGTAKDEDLDGH